MTMITIITMMLVACQDYPQTPNNTDIPTNTQAISPINSPQPINAANNNPAMNIYADSDMIPVAVIAGHKFYDVDIDAEMSQLPESLQHVRHDDAARAQILRAIVHRYLLSQHARTLGLDKQAHVQTAMRRAYDQIIIDDLEHWRMQQFVSPSKKTIAHYYNENLQDFTIPEQIHVRHILVANKEIAINIHTRLLNGADFAALAAMESLDDSNKSRGGDLNWFARGVMVAEFENIAFALNTENPLSEPVQTHFGWHLIQLLDRKEASVKTLAEANDEIVERLRQQAWDNWLIELEDTAELRILESAYQWHSLPSKQSNNDENNNNNNNNNKDKKDSTTP